LSNTFEGNAERHFREAARNADRIHFNLRGLRGSAAEIASATYSGGTRTLAELRIILADVTLFSKTTWYL
jgi:hypothetical protein